MKILWPVILSAVTFLFPGAPSAGDPPHAPMTRDVEKDMDKNNPDISLHAVRLYQKYLSPVIGGNCPMYPSCSRYCMDAVNRHGAVMGWIMTCDRLMRCGRDEVKTAPVIWSRDGKRSHDPVSENDFWRK